MNFPKLKPGPRRTQRSCLTCRQWRVKCDLSRPCCEKCLNSGLECLGYGDGRPRASVHQEDPRVPALPQLQPVIPNVPLEVVNLEETVDFAAFAWMQDHSGPNGSTSTHNPRPSILRTAVVYRMSVTPTPLAADSNFDCTWAQRQDPFTSHGALPSCRSSKAEGFLDTTSGTQSGFNYLARVIEALCNSIPSSVDATQIVREGYFVRIVDEYQLQRGRFWFVNPPVTVRGSLVARLIRSKRWIWAMFLGAKLLQALSEDPFSTSRELIGWIDQFEKKFTLDSSSNPPLDDIRDSFSAQLELIYLSFLTIDIIPGYIRLRKALSGFLRLVATDPALYSEHPNGNLVVSFPRALSVPRNELKRFLMYDIATALVLGVPPMVEYGYDGEWDSTSHGLEWIHGVPLTFVQALSQVNSWRAGSRVAPHDDWQALENRVLAWEPAPVVLDGEGSGTGSVARLAVQESWRHAVLIYIYMGMCGTFSHDSRIQASIRQIIQLGETVANLRIGIHMFLHYVIAGIGARLERHRSIIHKRLLSFKGVRVYLFRGPQFSRVLDHLWHGVGVGGSPVVWDDYVRSRCSVIPI